ncbi:helix-turn-helix domain-containing protein [Maribellus comscasis]|uniref:Helix-turn-helix domain-containing protein n=1 Tax=Maribellus comscasis TaxID=2681766 RepID=A0A6I6K2L7_9BACT|nr:Crp/Fnr family transcriptional regulator [Maribellus comscasis]QGY47650.1 helix-turn-helix domain-containing protein [Maribellus comscasis]
MESNNIKCRDCVIKSSAVSVLNYDELGILEKGCFQTNFRKGELIFKQGSPAKHITYIRKGFVKLSKTIATNKEYIVSISKKGAYLGIQNLNKTNNTNYFSAYALTDTLVCFLDIDYFDQLIKRNGEFAAEVITYIINDEMGNFDRFLNNVQQQLPGRLANILFYFYQQVYNQNPFSLNITKAELASLIGTSRESVTRLLKDFQDDSIIKMDKNNIQILNESKLLEIKLKG